MSTPLTPIDGDRTDETNDHRTDDLVTDLAAEGPALETDDLDDATDAEKDLIEVDAEDDATLEASETDPAAASETQAAEPQAGNTGRSLLALVLGALLLVSVAFNLKQSRDIANLDARSQEYEQALGAAVERIDSESARADGAESALDRVDAAVDVVNERVLGLQEALDGLREATVR